MPPPGRYYRQDDFAGIRKLLYGDTPQEREKYQENIQVPVLNPF
jgi:hypothetical protein